MKLQALTWEAVLFEGDSEGQRFSDLAPELLRHAAEIGLPLLAKGEEAFTIATDVDVNEP